MRPNKRADPAAAVQCEGMALYYGQAPGGSRKHDIAVEAPVNIVYGSLPFAVMMTSPCDLEDFAYGFSFTEGIVDNADDIRTVTIEKAEAGLRLCITLKAENMQRHLSRSRNLTGRTGCGVCGVADLAELEHLQLRLRATAAADTLSSSAIERALRDSLPLQALNRQTHAVHGAALCRRDGSIAILREDVGRHNALDKLIGAMLRAGLTGAEGFMLITSRASYEMVEKTARIGVPVLVAMSAPTSLAIERAKSCGLTLLAVARDDGAVVFSHADRITGQDIS